MCPRYPNQLTPNSDLEAPQAPPLLYCQIGTGYIHFETKAALCEACFENLSSDNKKHWAWIRTHRLIIDGILTGVNCENCDNRLTRSRLGDFCNRCQNKYNQYLENPNSVSVTVIEDTVVIGIELLIEPFE